MGTWSLFMPHLFLSTDPEKTQELFSMLYTDGILRTQGGEKSIKA